MVKLETFYEDIAIVDCDRHDTPRRTGEVPMGALRTKAMGTVAASINRGRVHECDPCKLTYRDAQVVAIGRMPSMAPLL
jgi:hypothetical protein